MSEKRKVKDLEIGMVIKEGETEHYIVDFLPDILQKNGTPRRCALIKRYEANIDSQWFGHIHILDCILGKYESTKTIKTSQFHEDDQVFYEFCARKSIRKIIKKAFKKD